MISVRQPQHWWPFPSQRISDPIPTHPIFHPIPFPSFSLPAIPSYSIPFLFPFHPISVSDVPKGRDRMEWSAYIRFLTLPLVGNIQLQIYLFCLGLLCVVVILFSDAYLLLFFIIESLIHCVSKTSPITPECIVRLTHLLPRK